MNILNLISLVVVLLLAGFFSTQGTFSTLLTLVMALFASILAMGAGDMAAGLMPSSIFEYAQGIGFLATFVVGFVVLRVASDMLIPKNVKLPKWPDKIASGAAGVLAGLIISGTLVVGIEMLPLGTSILGNGTIEDGQVGGRAFAGRFMTGLFYITNGGSLGGTSLASAHPDLGAELTKKRHTVRASVRQTLPQQYVSLAGAYIASPERLGQLHIESTGQVLIVRTGIEHGTSSHPDAQSSYDVGEGGSPAFFDVTPAQVRMVLTDSSKSKFKEINPIGYLDKGRTFEKVDLNGKAVLDSSGNVASREPLVEDYKDQPYDAEKQVVWVDKGTVPQAPPGTGPVKGDASPEASLVFIEWVFEIPEGYAPTFMEIKRGGIINLGGDVISQDKTLAPLAAWRYPPREDRSNSPVVAVTVSEDGQPFKGARVWIVQSQVVRSELSSMLNAAKSQLETNVGADSTVNWPTTPTESAVPDKGSMNQAYHTVVDRVQNKNLTDKIDWKDAVQVLIYGNVGRNGPQNVKTINELFAGDFTAAIEKSGTLLVKGTTDSSGKIDPAVLPTDKVTVIVVISTQRAFRVWLIDEDLKKKDNIKIDLPKSAAPTYEIDVDKKVK